MKVSKSPRLVLSLPKAKNVRTAFYNYLQRLLVTKRK